jgi:hypothetical protein
MSCGVLVCCQVGECSSDREPHSRKCAHKARELDLSVWFQPTAAHYFGRVRKPQILIALKEAEGIFADGCIIGMKESGLAALGERETAGTDGCRRQPGQISPWKSAAQLEGGPLAGRQFRG